MPHLLVMLLIDARNARFAGTLRDLPDHSECGDVYSTTTPKAALVFLSPVLVVLLSIFVLAVQVGAGLYFGV